MKKAYIRPEFNQISIEVERILEGSPTIPQPGNEAGDGDDMTQGYNGNDWSEE